MQLCGNQHIGMKVREKNHNRGREWKLTARDREERSLEQTKQTERSEERAVEEVSLDKDREKDRISLSQSRGRGNKRRLQREEDRIMDSLGIKKEV